ncbi:MAG: hypothetical protein J4F45_15175, partial [Pseudomonadales bacterium]|nr:hypothetical protein [Pseudomonadales bacterium]
MVVGSYFESIVLALGWIVYDGVWAVLNDTGKGDGAPYLAGALSSPVSNPDRIGSSACAMGRRSGRGFARPPPQPLHREQHQHREDDQQGRDGQ